MSDLTLNEEPLQFGEGGRLLGILTLPSVVIQESLPVFVFLSAGLLHRVGPHRLHVRLARELGRMGFRPLRVDLAGRGDSPERIGLKNQAAAAADFAEILGVLDSRLGTVPLVLAGLCAGADDAIRLSLSESRVVGMLLLDPVCEKDAGFARRALVVKYTNPARYVAWLRNRWKELHNPRPELTEGVDSISLRDVPTPMQMRTAFESIRERKGRVISLFTQYALSHYNQEGQLARVLGVDGYEEFCSEEFWPRADHTFTTELHRRKLICRISEWAAGFRSA